MGSYCATEESSVSNCSLFIDDFVSLLTCVNKLVGIKVCVTVYISMFTPSHYFHPRGNWGEP